MKLSVRAVASLRVVASFVCMDAVSSCDWSADSQFVAPLSALPQCMTVADHVCPLRDVASGCCTSVVHCISNVDVLHRRRQGMYPQPTTTYGVFLLSFAGRSFPAVLAKRHVPVPTSPHPLPLSITSNSISANLPSLPPSFNHL